MVVQRRPSHILCFSSLSPLCPISKPSNSMVHKCTHYGETGHLKEWCYEDIGYPDWWDFTQKPQKNMDKVTVATIEEEHSPNASANVV